MSDPIEFLKVLRALPPYAATKLFREKLKQQRRQALPVQTVYSTDKSNASAPIRARETENEVRNDAIFPENHGTPEET